MIIKRRVTRQFVQLENALVRDRRLSLDEHGMLHYLLSLPDDWEVNQIQCAKFWKIGRDRCRRIFRSLRKSGWAQLEVLQADDGGLIGTRWVIGDDPGPEETEEVLKREDEQDDAGEQGTTVAPESKNPDALASASPVPTGPTVDPPDSRVTRQSGNKAPSRRQTLEENRESTNTTAEAAQSISDDDDIGEPPPKFGELLRLWPGDNVVSAYACERAFAKLSDWQRLLARNGIKPYLQECRDKGQNRLCDLRTYLDERRFDKYASRVAGPKLFVAKRGSPQADRWHEYLKRMAPEKVAIFKIALAGAGYTTTSEWPPALPAKSATGPPASPTMTEEDEREQAKL